MPLINQPYSALRLLLMTTAVFAVHTAVYGLDNNTASDSTNESGGDARIFLTVGDDGLVDIRAMGLYKSSADLTQLLKALAVGYGVEAVYVQSVGDEVKFAKICEEIESSGLETILFGKTPPVVPVPWPLNYALHMEQQNTVRVDIFNVKGDKVRVLVDETLPAGDHLITWNEAIPYPDPGVYFMKVFAGSQDNMGVKEVRKMVIPHRK